MHLTPSPAAASDGERISRRTFAWLWRRNPLTFRFARHAVSLLTAKYAGLANAAGAHNITTIRAAAIAHATARSGFVRIRICFISTLSPATSRGSEPAALGLSQTPSADFERSLTAPEPRG